MVARQSYAIILAGGVGSRLSALTNLTPKALVKVNGREILDFAIAGYLEAGLCQENIIVVTGYKCEMIEAFLARNYPKIRTIKIAILPPQTICIRCIWR